MTLTAKLMRDVGGDRMHRNELSPTWLWARIAFDETAM